MFKRHRRLRSSKNIRNMIAETKLSMDDFIYPIFVIEGEDIKEEIEGLPNNHRYSVDRLNEIIDEVRKAKINAILLFGIPKEKDSIGKSAYQDNGIVQRAIKEIKKLDPNIYIITDVCMCQYTDHGHCGILNGENIDNDLTVEYLGKIALSHAKAGADMVAPSDMMDGRVDAIREILDNSGFKDIPIMGYSAKYASSFYGPFRSAANSKPSFGDRKSYQMDIANSREALSEIEEDIVQGADIVMVKPALSFLDIIAKARERFNIPIVAYNVSGEYAMIKNAGKMGIIDEKKIAMEVLISIKRAGADLIISYYALEVAKWLKEENID
ncbi:MAG: porphobilinogen synthase [Andreesenia angusta]|nr:porphobilinogen synthase [Andreesenia angusta]